MTLDDDRRDYRRNACRVVVTIQSKLRTGEGVILDLSDLSAFISTSMRAEIGDILGLSFVRPTDGMLILQEAVVMRIVPRGDTPGTVPGIGVEFIRRLDNAPVVVIEEPEEPEEPE